MIYKFGQNKIIVLIFQELYLIMVKQMQSQNEFIQYLEKDQLYQLRDKKHIKYNLNSSLNNQVSVLDHGYNMNVQHKKKRNNLKQQYEEIQNDIFYSDDQYNQDEDQEDIIKRKKSQDDRNQIISNACDGSFDQEVARQYIDTAFNENKAKIIAEGIRVNKKVNNYRDQNKKIRQKLKINTQPNSNFKHFFLSTQITKNSQQNPSLKTSQNIQPVKKNQPQPLKKQITQKMIPQENTIKFQYTKHQQPLNNVQDKILQNIIQQRNAQKSVMNKISCLQPRDQLTYLQKQIQFYQKLRNNLLKKLNLDLEQNKRQYRGFVKNRVRPQRQKKQQIEQDSDSNETISKNSNQNNHSLHNIYDKKNYHKKKMRITPELLRILSKKFQMFNAYQNKHYDPGYKISIVVIAQQLNLGHSSVYHLYNQWLTDPSFSQRFSKFNDSIRESGNIQSLGQPSDSNYANKEYNHFEAEYRNFKQQNLQTKKRSFRKNAQINQAMNKMIAQTNTKIQKAVNINSEYNTQKAKALRLVYCQNFKRIKNQTSNIFFLDQCPLAILFGPNSNLQNQTKDMNLSLMAILSINGSAFWKLVKYDGNKYEQVQEIKNLYERIQSEAQISGNLSKSYICLDSSVTKQQEIRIKIKTQTKARILLLPFYSQQLNPLEYWFKQIRQILKRFNNSSLNDLNTVLQNPTNFDFQVYLREMQRYINRGLSKQSF